MESMLHYDKVVPSPRGGAVGAGVGEDGWQGLSPPGTVSLCSGAEPRLAMSQPWPRGRQELGEVLPDPA